MSLALERALWATGAKEAAMQLEPLPERREFLSFGFPSISEGIEAGRRIMVGRLRPAVVRLYGVH